MARERRGMLQLDAEKDSEPRPAIIMPVSPVTVAPMVAMPPVMAMSPMPAMPHLDDFSTGGTGGHRSLLAHSGHSLGVCRQSEEGCRTERESRESCFDTHELPPFCARATARDHDGSGTNARKSANGNILNPPRILRRIGCGRYVIGDSGSRPMPPPASASGACNRTTRRFFAMMREAIAAMMAMSATCTGGLAADSTKILSPAARAITASGEKPFGKPFDPMPSLTTSETANGGEQGGVAPDSELIGEPTQ
jgi:hypothetical protein